MKQKCLHFYFRGDALRKAILKELRSPFGITILKLKSPIWAFFLFKKNARNRGRMDELFEIGGVIFEEFSNLDCGIEAFEMVVGMTAFTHR